jgi:excisionase family DNA binding protein
MQPLTFDQLHALPTVVDLMTAARALGIGRTKAYQLAHDGQFPVRIIRVGTHYHIPTAELLKVLGITPVPLPRTTTENQTTETGARGG